jgi:hypothetical protein
MNQAQPLHHPGQDAQMAEWPSIPCFHQRDEPVEISIRLCSRKQGRVRDYLAHCLANEG